MLLMELARTNFPEIILTKVQHSFCNGQFSVFYKRLLQDIEL